jgi:hypothetical protein
MAMKTINGGMISSRPVAKEQINTDTRIRSRPNSKMTVAETLIFMVIPPIVDFKVLFAYFKLILLIIYCIIFLKKVKVSSLTLDWHLFLFVI